VVLTRCEKVRGIVGCLREYRVLNLRLTKDHDKEEFIYY